MSKIQILAGKSNAQHNFDEMKYICGKAGLINFILLNL